ncbi:RNA polymerase sigma factor [Chryseobacterium sp. Marseille-Q8038]
MLPSNRHITPEEQSFRNHLQKFRPLLLSIISKKIKERDDIKDVFQNVHIQLWINRARLNTKDVEAIVVNVCNQKIADFYRKNVQRLKHSALDEDLSLIESDSPDYEIKEQQLSNLEIAIDDLIPPIRQKIFKMNKLEGITQENIAVELNIPKRTVKYHIQQSLLFIKNRIFNHKNS